MNGNISRRRLLGLGMGVAAGSALAACGSGGSTSGGGGGSGSAPAQLKTPTFVAPKTVDGAVVSKIEGVPTAYSKFGTPYKSVTEIPGKGGVVTTFQPLFRPPQPPLADNPWWQGLNERLGVEIKPTMAPSASYPDKLATTVSGGKIPDLTVVSIPQSPGAAKLVKQGAFLDLSDRLGGDGVKDYPNLAAIPTQAWKDAAIENKIYGIPMPIANGGRLYREDWAKKIGMPELPTNADEAKALLTAFTKAGPDGSTNKKTYSFSAFGHGTAYAREMFGVPNQWSVTKSGEFTGYIESEAYEASLAWCIDMWKAGAWHPDAPSQTGEQQEDLWLSGQAATYQLGVTNLYGLFFVEGSVAFQPPGHDGGKAGLWLDPAMYAFTALPSTVKDEDRIHELLSILNWWAGPFGSEEYLYIAYGLEGRQYNMVKGEPVAVDDETIGTERNGYWMVQQFESALYFPGHPERAAAAQQQVEQVFNQKVADPSRGLISDTSISKAASLAQLIADYETGIITGRRKISELADLRSRWASGGGAAIKKEFAASYAKANGR